MPLIPYINKRFSPANQPIVEKANEIIDEYQAQGFKLTLRQLYYQFVARDIIPNKQTEYRRLGGIINDARLAGLIDWDAIEDRTRNVRAKTRWESPAQIVRAAASGYHRDMWDGQKSRPEVWIEKDALVGVIEAICEEYDVPYFACRGYTSQSEQWAAGRRFLETLAGEQTPVVLHLGDHDPSGIDMTRDNMDRLRMFAESEHVVVHRLALNMDQVRRYRPPPNPAKNTDSRFSGYVEQFGPKCWELDALDPRRITALIRVALDGLIDDRNAWNARVREVAKERESLTAAASDWAAVSAWLGKRKR